MSVSAAKLHIVTLLAKCSHDRAEPVDGGARWCIDCGAYFPARGPVHVRYPSSVTAAKLLEAPS